MTQASRDRSNAELESLYRQAGEAEPDAGIDRMIRARAEQAVRRSTNRSRTPWLGGLIAASVAVVAIAVVLQQSPPSPELPDAPAPAARQSAPAAPEPAGKALGAERETTENVTGARLAEPSTDLTGASADPAPQAARARAAEPVSEARYADDAADRETFAPESRETLAPAPPADPDELLRIIRERLEAGRIDEARSLLDQLRAGHPGFAVPEEIEDALAPPDEPGP